VDITPRDSLVFRGFQDHQDLKELAGDKGDSVLKENEGRRGLLESQVNLEKMVETASMAETDCLVQRDKKGQLELPVSLEQRVGEAYREHPVVTEQKDVKDPQDQRAQREKLGHEVFEECAEEKELRESLEKRG
jgi:hypothetical protein